MAVFSQYNTNGFSGDSIGLDESYTGADGLYRIMEESEINKHSIFEHVIGCDFVEAATNNGMMLESELEAINEASGSGIFGKVIEFFKKLGEKIKGIIQNIIDRLTAVFTKDGKSLVNKFKKKINEKLNKGEYSDEHFKYKWCKVKSGTGVLDIDALGAGNSAVADAILSAKVPSNAENKLYRGKNIREVFGDPADATYDKNDYTSGDGYVGRNTSAADNTALARASADQDFNKSNEKKLKTHREKKLEKFNTDEKERDYRTPIGTDDLKDYKDAILSQFVANTDSASFAKDIDEAIFDDEDEKEGFTASDYQLCTNILTDTKTLNKLEKEKRQVDKQINEIVKQARKWQKEMDKLSRGSNYSRAAGLARAMSTSVISMGNVCTACSTMVYAAYTAAVKKNIKQARAVFVKAATYTKKKSANEAALYEAYAEVSDYEVDQMLPEF